MSAKNIVMAAAGSAGAVAGLFIEDVFSTHLYTGNDGTQTINNGIQLGNSYSGTTLKLSFDTNTTDEANSFAGTVTGSAARTTSDSKFGSASCGGFNGSSWIDYPQGAGDFGSGDWTVEFWVKTTTGDGPGLVTQASGGGAGATSWGFFVGYGTSGNISLYLSDGSSYFAFITTGITAVNNNVWNHVAASRSGSTVRLFLNGVLQGSANVGTTALGNGGLPVRIGAQGSGYAMANGFIDDVRIVKGTAVYTANFTPPTSATSVSQYPPQTTAGHGGLVWTKSRSNAQNHYLADTVSAQYLISNGTNPSQGAAFQGLNDITSATATGYNLGPNSSTVVNSSGQTQVSWTFRQASKFFRVVTWTGNGVAGRQIAHNLGSVPGCIIVKPTNTSNGWAVYHRSLGNGKFLRLDLTQGEVTSSAYWNNTDPTSTHFTIGTDPRVNDNGVSYVGLVFAHNAGGFGLSGNDNVISCGSFTTDGSGAGLVGPDLGWEPQFVILKNATSTGSGDWWMMDSMRGMTADSATNYLQSNTSSAASNFSAGTFRVTATGFKIPSNAFASGQTFIYIAIRRGPMRVPTSGSQVFYSQAVAQQSIIDSTGVPFPPDLVNTFSRNGTDRSSVFNLFMFVDRLRGLGTPSDAFSTDSDGPFLVSSSTDAESNTTSYVQLKADGKNITRGGGWGSTGYGNWIYHFLRRAPVFFDEVCYTGDGSPKNITHNLTVAPELLIVKSRGTAGDWAVGGTILGLDNFLRLNLTNGTANNSAYWGNALPNATTFRIGNAANVNDTTTFVALLFASCPGVSKIGTYTGNGSSQTINCGFSTGARFVLIKRTDSTGDWYVWDTARGIVAANDPHLSLNSTAAEVTTNDSIDPDNSGFIVNQVAATNINVNAATYIYLAIA